MPFLDSNTIRPLYDVHDGGPPRGFRCMIYCYPLGHKKHGEQCYKVTRTLTGMKAHQRIIHGFKSQPGFQFNEIARTQQD